MMTDTERDDLDWAHIDWDDEHGLEKAIEKRRARRRKKVARLRRKACMYLRLATLLDWDWWLGRVTFKDYLAATEPD